MYLTEHIDTAVNGSVRIYVEESAILTDLLVVFLSASKSLADIIVPFN
jgi:hypothetical protein